MHTKAASNAHTGGHARDQEEGNDGTKAPTEEQRLKDNLTGRHDATNHNKGDNSTMTSTKTWILDNAKTPAEVQQAKDDITGTLDARDHNEGDDSANTSDMCTKPLRKSNDQSLRSTPFQRSGTERQQAKEDAETHTGVTKTLTDGSIKTLTRALDSSKALTGEHARDSDKGDANDPRRDTQHAKAISTEDTNAKDNTARDTDGSDTYPLVGLRPEEAPRQRRRHIRTEYRYGRFPRAHM